MSAGARWTAAGLLLAVAAIGGGTSSLISLFWLRTDTTTAIYQAGSTVAVHSDCGSVTVRAGAAGAVSVHTFERWSFQRPTVTATQTGGTTTLNVACSWWSFGVGSTLDVTVDVPSSSAVTVDTSAGDIAVSGISGSLTAQTSAGAVDAVGLSSPDVAAHSSAGDVQLAFTVTPATVDATSSGGDITVLVPRASVSYRVDAASSGGTTDVTVPTDPASGRSIRASSSGGDVTVSFAP